MDKQFLFEKGVSLMTAFCQLNDIPIPRVKQYTSAEWWFQNCAYYRPVCIHVCIPKCAHVGKAGRQWSYPGYAVDRTPYGVIQHELGHHIDRDRGEIKGAYQSDFSQNMRLHTGEKKITNYCPDDGEWFAEIFRLFVTNPDLLKHMRPKTHQQLTARFKPVFNDPWENRLRNAPERTINAARNKCK